ncbi:MAG: type IV toxin-antitoxin system AbiEi family antitoxin domain-containing protein [Gammaproteobacteria bacterium]|nr:type IV toxin-antitoxin system AbiEi family antitoxin domain-containing protein [Gammaproteobacteria bacterium]
MPAVLSKVEAVRELAQRQGVVRPRDLAERDLPEFYLHRLWQRGELELVERGLYRSPDAPVTEHHSLVEAAAKVPGGVICLLSALSFHGLGTQCPEEVWLAIGRKAHLPQTELPLRVVRFAPTALRAGVRTHTVEGVEVPVTTVAKTLCDLAKFRHQVGFDVLEEALRDGWKHQRFTLPDLWRYARVCRVVGVLKPLIEQLPCAR